MKIDSHQHFWKFHPSEYFWVAEGIQRDFTPGDLRPVLIENGFNGCIAVQARQSEEETFELLESAASFPFIKGVVGWVDLSSSRVEERLEYFKGKSFFKGVRHTVWDQQGEFLTKPAFEHGIGILGKLGLTYDILVFDYQLSAAVDLVKKFPNQVFVLNHMGRPNLMNGELEEWAVNMRELGRLENVFCKISGLVSLAGESSWSTVDFTPALDQVVTSFGTDRILFGSDWPVCLSEAHFNEVVQLTMDYFKDFSDEEKSNFFGMNAAKIYGLVEDG